MPQDALLDHCLELLSAVGRPRSRRMFGGQGLYVDELFIALIVFDRLYLKADDETRARFQAAGCQPFTYPKKGGSAVVLSYWTAPDEAMDSPDAMAPWARMAMAAALRARQAAPKPVRKRKVPAPDPAATAAAPAASAARRRTASARAKR
ncbi:TfoX/Sxy family protein [Ideonella sp. BN130291]|uniref:TfoX/Sxy family protein n=1 Tax=Ideonella sp. BN130291 TaxID=3112940 RepID=UPI002E2662B3|nr:TfoX/Sxy family protein [Ideonella sp. BN130291]